MPTSARKAAKKKVKKAVSRKLTAAGGKRAPVERVGLIEVGGRPATVIGRDVKVGQKAPRFKAQVGKWAGMNTWAGVEPLAATRGKVRILAAMSSLDTNVCDEETRRFNEEASRLGNEVQVIAVTMDLPIAQSRWCGAAGVERVAAVSDHMAGEFGVKYGTLIKERRWFRRAVFVVDKDDVICYVTYLPKLGDQPNYEEVLATARQLVAA